MRIILELVSNEKQTLLSSRFYIEIGLKYIVLCMLIDGGLYIYEKIHLYSILKQKQYRNFDDTRYSRNFSHLCVDEEG